MKNYFFLSSFLFFSTVFLCTFSALAGDFDEWEEGAKAHQVPLAALKNENAVFNAHAWDESAERENEYFQDQPSSQPAGDYSGQWLEAVRHYPANHGTARPIAHVDEQSGAHASTHRTAHAGTQSDTHVDPQANIHMGAHLDGHFNGFMPNPRLNGHVDREFQNSPVNRAFLASMAAASNIQINNSTGGLLPFGCELCGERFYFRASLTDHVRKHGRPEKRKPEEQPERKAARKPRVAGSFFCDFCSKSFTQNAGLTAHIRIHTGDRPFVCGWCGKSFTQSCNLSRHINNVCGSDDISPKKHQCQECSFSSDRSDTFSAHMQKHEREKRTAEGWALLRAAERVASRALVLAPREIEGKDRPYGCESCPKRFNHKSNLRVHMKVHTEDKEYSCSFCHASFRHSGTLKSHERIHTGEKVHACRKCGKRFMHRNTRNNHEKKHE